MGFLRRHIRFHAAFLGGLAGGLLAYRLPLGDRVLIGADLFFVAYLISTVVWMRGMGGQDLRDHFAEADEGSLMISVMTLGAVSISLYAIIQALVSSKQADPFILRPVLALAAVPLGWATVHTVMAFHYAGLYYARDPEYPKDETEGALQDQGGLEFPGNCNDPGPVEFLYYSFTLGMAAQTSDVVVTSTGMRRDTLMHSIISYVYNTVIVALAVNAGMSLWQGN